MKSTWRARLWPPEVECEILTIATSHARVDMTRPDNLPRVFQANIEPVMISNGVLPVGSTADFDIVTARRANCCSRKNFDKASSCSVVGLRSSLACSGTSPPPKCAAFIAHYGSAMTAAANELLIAHPPNPNTG
jgi:hypothetical protein